MCLFCFVYSLLFHSGRMHARRSQVSPVGGGNRMRCLRGRLPEDQYEYDDEDNDTKRDIHKILSLLMMVHPSPSADHPALGVPCGNQGFRGACRPTAEHYARCLVHIADWQPRSQRMISIVSASLTRARSKTQTLWQRRTAVASGRDGLLSPALSSKGGEGDRVVGCWQCQDTPGAKGLEARVLTLFQHPLRYPI